MSNMTFGVKAVKTCADFHELMPTKIAATLLIQLINIPRILKKKNRQISVLILAHNGLKTFSESLMLPRVLVNCVTINLWSK